jgi:hypothetical protein
MIKEKQLRRPVIDLTGPQGNAFALLAYAQNFHRDLKKIDISLPDFKIIKSEMMSGDYENLIATFDKYFGSYVDLER